MLAVNSGCTRGRLLDLTNLNERLAVNLIARVGPSGPARSLDTRELHKRPNLASYEQAGAMAILQFLLQLG